MNPNPTDPRGQKTPIDESRLFRVIGEIDDRFVAEAMTYRKKVRKRPALRVLTTLAACLAIVLLIRVLPALLDTESGKDAPSDGKSPQILWSLTEGYDANTSLIACLSELRTEAIPSSTAPTTDDGSVKIIWRDEASGTYYAVTLDRASRYEIEKLQRLIETSQPAAAVESDDAAAPYSLWISTGNGLAVSPYLPYEDGTVFYGLPADYAPEHLPAETFAAFLEELLRAETAALSE